MVPIAFILIRSNADRDELPQPKVRGIPMTRTQAIPLKDLFLRNEAWSDSKTKIDPNYFTNLANYQNPEYLWIGCSDSRVPANQVIGLNPGEVFVHRNIANVVVHTDLNCLSVLQYAVEVLNVKHIIVCGHYGCGGIKAAFDGNEHGLIDNWLRHIKDVYRWHKNEIDAQKNEHDKLARLCEKNVIEQVTNVCHTTIIQNAWKAKKELTIHGWIYSMENGLIKSLGVEVNGTGHLSATHALRD